MVASNLDHSKMPHRQIWLRFDMQMQNVKKWAKSKCKNYNTQHSHKYMQLFKLQYLALDLSCLCHLN